MNNDSIQFEWDEEKNIENQRKHGVSFEEGQTVFQDPDAVVYFDEEHSEAEERFIIVGFSIKVRIMMVVHCLKYQGETIRIISARKAISKEIEDYEESHGSRT